MKREDKYPNTETFTFHNANPKGRYTTDCVYRAISTALDMDYKKVVMEMAEMQCETGYDSASSQLIDKYLESKGCHKHKQPRKANGKKYTGKEFCEVIGYGKVIANIGSHHIVAIIDGKVYDTWDSTDGCIGNYWTFRGWD